MSNCGVHESVAAIAHCRNCGIGLCEDCVGEIKGGAFTCRKCTALGAVADFTTSEELRRQEWEEAERQQLENRKGNRLQKVLIVILLASGTVMATQYFLTSTRDLPPDFYYTTPEEQTAAMECYNNLYTIAALLREDRLEDIQTMNCPIHGQPYIVQQINGDIVVIDPEPTAMGFRDIRVARSIGMPEFTPLSR